MDRLVAEVEALPSPVNLGRTTAECFVGLYGPYWGIRSAAETFRVNCNTLSEEDRVDMLERLEHAMAKYRTEYTQVPPPDATTQQVVTVRAGLNIGPH